MTDLEEEFLNRIKTHRSGWLIKDAFEFAKEKHKLQVCKYNINEPYIIHPMEVASTVYDVTDDCEMICSALLHDTIEDTDTTYQEIINVGFGKSIADLVLELTDISMLSDGNRAARKTIDRNHTACASQRGKTIKLADCINNTTSIINHDPGFAKVYMTEMELLLEALKEGDQKLYITAELQVELYFAYICR